MGKPADVKIEDATARDVDRIVAYNAALAEESEGLMPDLTTLREGVRALLADPTKGRYFLGEVEGRRVGQLLITYEWSDWRNGTFIWLQSVYVEPEFRRRGVFRALYEHVKRMAEEDRYCGIRLYVHNENDGARQVYERLGMVSGDYLVLETPDRLRHQGAEQAGPPQPG